MTIQRTRQLLGKRVENLTDAQVRSLIVEYFSLAESLLLVAMRATVEQNTVRNTEGGKYDATTGGDLRQSL